MHTLTLLRRVAAQEPGECEEALTALTADDSHYPALLHSLGQTADMSMTFWNLSLLVNYFLALLQRDASQAIPLLMGCLAWGDGPVCDRAAWALDVIGKPALEALLTNLEAADTAATARYIGAIRKNSSLHLVAKKAISLLAAKLASPSEEVQFWALTVLMDVGPLRPWFDKRLNKSTFEQIYGELLTTAYRLAPQRQYDFARRYSELLEEYFAQETTR